MTTSMLHLEDLIGAVEAGAPTGGPLDQLTAAVELSGAVTDLADSLVGHFVQRAKNAGCSWSMIGGPLGVTRQAAQQRWVALPGTERWTVRARKVVDDAGSQALSRNHNFIGTEHLLMALLAEEEGLAAKVLVALGVSAADVEPRVEAEVPTGERPVFGIPVLTARARDALKATVGQALQLGHNYVGTEHMLLALIAAHEGVAARVLEAAGVTVGPARAEVIRQLTGYPA